MSPDDGSAADQRPAADLRDAGSNGRPTDILRRFVVTVVVACLLAAAMNLFMLRVSPREERPLRAHEGSALSELLAAEPRSVRTRYLFPVVLGEATGGGTLVVPEGGLVDPFYLENLAGLDVEVRDFDPEVDAMTAQRFLGQGIVAEGALHPDGVEQTFVVVAEPIPADGRYRLLRNGGTAFVVPEATVTGSGS